MLLRTALLTAALTVAVAMSAFAQAPPSLDALKPCYVAAQESQRESVAISGHGFTPFAAIDIFVDEIQQSFPDPQPQAAFDGALSGSTFAPFIEEGQRVFTLRAAEHSIPARSAVAYSKVTRLSVSQTPMRASTKQRVRFRGRGFTDNTVPVYMHYVFAGRSRKTIKIGLPSGDCGLFSVKRRQFPFKKSPQVGLWTIQFDQVPTYDPNALVRVPLTIKVRKTPKVKPQRSQAR